MNNHLFKKQKCVPSFFLLLVILQPVLAYADQGTGSIEIDVRYTNHDRADYSSMKVIVYEDFDTAPFKEITSLSANPYNIVSLPIGHKYKVEVYANGMYATTGYVDLQSTQEVLPLTMPLPGGMRFSVFYNDGATAINDATVSIRSQDGKQWTQGITDYNGQTIRFWVQSTNLEDNYYIADVSIGSNLLYSYSHVPLKPGVPQEFKIVTPWPPVITSLITAKVLKNSSNEITTTDGNFAVQLYDTNRNKITSTTVNAKGQALFSNLKVGDYIFQAINQKDNTEWGSSKVTLDGKQNTIQIFKNQPIVKIGEPTPNATKNQLPQPNASNNQVPQRSNQTNPAIPNCKCVAFRLDDIQDYWLDSVQTKIIDTFKQKNASLTVGLIGNSFGSDIKLA